jgi:hypothetical protein
MRPLCFLDQLHISPVVAVISYRSALFMMIERVDGMARIGITTGTA